MKSNDKKNKNNKTNEQYSTSWDKIPVKKKIV